MKISSNESYCNLFSFAVSCKKRFLVGSRPSTSNRNTSKHEKAIDSRSELPFSHTLQTFLMSSNTDFIKKVTKAFLSVDIPLYKQNNKHIKNLFHNIGHSLLCEANCRKTLLQLSEGELERIRNAVHDKLIFLVVDKNTLSGINIKIF